MGKPGNASMDLDTFASMDDIGAEFVKEYQELSDSKKKRLLAYMNMLQNAKE